MRFISETVIFIELTKEKLTSIWNTKMGVTEVAFLPLQDGKILDDPATAATKTHNNCLGILLAQKGCQRVYWGLQAENTSLLLWLVDWDDIEDHIKFTKAE